MTESETEPKPLKSILVVHREPPVSDHPDADDYDQSQFRDATHVVRLTLGSWRYRGYARVQVGGNCKGSDILTAAIESWIEEVEAHILENGGFFDEKDDTDNSPAGKWDYTFYSPEGTEMSGEVFGDASDVRRELEAMVIGAEIIELSGKDVDAKRERDRLWEAMTQEEKDAEFKKTFGDPEYGGDESSDEDEDEEE